ncbi:hypothetical protein FE257_000781 [Aspergillus nanangensis]|uniref:Zn(2)-C6 fungal-type domain-containing protein n=1 Tax=Aspergillus nanangensis TaxID=2582783 RepID=A0AAD4CEI8_ASPNN|nr:hypothetical protein FE257_000781 [Aspergillus nanangensis]
MASAAPNACLACAQKKRKCDRKLPVCSTCRRLLQLCRYARLPHTPLDVEASFSYGFTVGMIPNVTNVFHVAQSWSQHTNGSPPSTPPATERAPRACNGCRKGKRHCDRALLSCARCTRLRIRCVYGPMSTESAHIAPPMTPPSMDIQRVDARVPFPVSTKKHMPMLLHSFIQTFGMEPLPVDTDSLAFNLRSSWIQQALSDACFFHATLFAASAHMDAFRGVGNNQMTLYHHTMALRLLNDRLARPEGIMDEGAIACIAPLVFFSSMGSDERSSRIHRQGLMQMVRAKGGLHKLGKASFLSALIPVCTLTEAIIFDTKLDIPFLDVPDTLPTPPTYLISAMLSRATRANGRYSVSAEVIHIFEEIHSAALYLADEYHGPLQRSRFELTRAKWHYRLQRAVPQDNNSPATRTTSDPTPPDGISQSCHVAALIYWFLLDDFFPASSDTLQRLVDDLKAALVGTTMDTWVKCAPEAHTWICLVGAAAACNVDDRAWFSLRHGQPVICIRSEGPELYLQCWGVYN